MRVMFVALFTVASLLFATLTIAQEPSAQIGYTSEVPVLDGLDNDAAWDTAETYSNFEIAGGTSDGDADLFTVWKALWDEDNLYAHVQVVDDSVFEYSGDPAFSDWNSDSIEFYFDANLQGFTHKLINGEGVPYDYQNEFAGEPVYQLTILNNQLELHEGVNHAEYLARNGDDADLSAGWDQQETSYALEIAFPWEALGADPDTIFGQDGIMAMGIAINDEDDGAERDAQGMWATSDGSLWHDATMFPLVQLDPKPDDPEPGLPGDANGDGIVNATDLNIVGGNWQMAVDPAGPANGDFDSNGFVDAADLNVIGTNWQRTAAPQGAAVPEPAGLCLLGIGALALSQLRRRNS